MAYLKGKWRNNAETFWSRVTHTQMCWLWTGATTRAGYGLLSWEGQLRYAHTVAWLLTYGTEPPAAELRHTCDTPACVRPDHLVPGTHAENMRDMAVRGRSGTAKLQPDAVKQIRQLYVQGLKQAEIATQFGIAQTTVSAVIRRQNWKYVLEEPHA